VKRVPVMTDRSLEDRAVIEEAGQAVTREVETAINPADPPGAHS
jgi:hypothetical protein